MGNPIDNKKVMKDLADLEVIKQRAWRDFCRYVGKMRWRKEEPGDQVPEEQPLRFNLLLCQALAEDLISPSTAAALRGESVMGLVTRLRLIVFR